MKSAALVLASLVSAWVIAQPAQADGEASLLFVGDVIPHRMVVDLARARAPHPSGGAGREGYAPMLRAVEPLVRAHDAAVFNMEAPVGLARHRPEAEKRFLASPELAAAFEAAGFDVAVCANNHAMDQGADGVRDTLSHLEAVKLRAVGCGGDAAGAAAPVWISAGGLRIALLAFSTVLNGNVDRVRQDPASPKPMLCSSRGDCGDVLEAVRRVRAEADAVVVSAHWGREYEDAPPFRDQRLARALVDAGADVIVGHHPHVLVPAVWMPREGAAPALVIHSLGNFLVEQCGLHPELQMCDRRLATAASLRLSRGPGGRARVGAEFVPLWIEHRRGCPGEVSPPARCISPTPLEPGPEPGARLERGRAQSLREARYQVVRAFMGPFDPGAALPRYDAVVKRITGRSDLGTRLKE